MKSKYRLSYIFFLTSLWGFILMLPCHTVVLNAQAGSYDSLPVWSPDGSQIAFVSNRSGTYDLWVMDADGSDATDLTLVADTPLVWNPEPVWSPDGRFIAFSSDRSGNTDVWVVAVDGSSVINLTADNEGLDWEHTWSPNGFLIAYVKVTETGSSEIIVTDPDGSNPITLVSGNYDFFDLAWSPDGNAIASGVFDLDEAKFEGVWITTLDEPKTLPLTAGREDRGLQWSPDGQVILMFNYDLGLNVDIWTVNADGTNLRNLTEDSSSPDLLAKWSPDGDQIVFGSTRGGMLSDIWIMNADGSNAINLTPNMKGMELYPQWSPDGRWIAFASSQAGDSDVWIMRADGSDKTNLTGE